ncbi:MAG TPA: sulfatase, partial [Solirubrobacteraceae bacterium]
MLHRFVPVLASALLLSPLLDAEAVRAQCTRLAEAGAVARSAAKRARCNDSALRVGPTTSCISIPAPPPCAGSLVDEAIALAYGPNNPAASTVDRRALRTQLACQRQIGRAAARFIGVKLRNRIAGRTRRLAEARARREVDRLPKKCAVTVTQDASGVVVPAVSATCRGTVGDPGHRVDPDALRACLLPALEPRVDAAAPSPPPRANLIIILTDDQRWDTVDLTHSRDGVTPVMPAVEAELAASGITFTNAVVTTALCCPSRSSILKGEYAHTTGVESNQQPLGGALNFDDSSSVATWLHAAGYRTGLYGKYLNGYNQLWTPPAPPYVPPGWDEWHAFRGTKYYDYALVENGTGFDHALVSYPSGCATYTNCPGDQGGCTSPTNYSTDVLFQKALAFLDSQPSGQPFFLYVAPFAPHGPACPAKQDEGSFAAIAPWRPPNWNEADVSDKPAWVQSLCPMGAPKQANIDKFRRMQLESLQAVDRGVAALMDKLRQVGHDQDTLVLFTGDNGYSWGAHCHGPKRCPYEECMRVPLIVRYPPLVPQPRVEPRMGLNIDFAFTVAELAGVVPPVQQDGRSLERVL